MNKEQIQLLEARLSGDSQEMMSHVHSIKKRALRAMENFYHMCDNQILEDKRPLVETKIHELEINTADDTISKALVISALINELESKNE